MGANVTTAVYAARLVAHADLGEAGAAAAAAFADALGVAAAIAAAAALLSLMPPRARRDGGAPRRLDTASRGRCMTLTS